MRVAMYYNNRDVRVEELPKPSIGPKELLVRVVASGICGSDVLEWYRLKKAPLVLGHEIAGEIVEVGADVKKYKVGQRVFVAHHVPCNQCRYCRSGDHTVCVTLHTTNFFPGGFSEYIRVPELNVDRGVFVLPPEISFDMGTLIEPLACVVRGERMAGIKPDQSVLILGAGVSGILHLLISRRQGAGRIIITDINKKRLELARHLGADIVIDAKEDLPKRLRKENQGRLADLVIVCTGATSAFKQSLECVERAGSILCFAATTPGVTLGLPVNDFWRQSIKIMHSYGASPSDCAEALEILRTREMPVDQIITHRLGMKETGRGFKLVAEAKDCLKVIINPAS